MTNKEKFIEVFGLEPNEHFCPLSEEISCGNCPYSENGCDEDHKDRFFSMEYKEPTTKNYLSEEDILELKHRYGDEVEFVVRDMLTGEDKRWDKLPSIEPTTKNNLGVDCISRSDVLKLMQDNWHTHNGDWAMQESMDDIRVLPSVTPQEPILDKINKMKSEIADSLEFWDYSPNNNPLARDILETLTNFLGDIREVEE